MLLCDQSLPLLHVGFVPWDAVLPTWMPCGQLSQHCSARLRATAHPAGLFHYSPVGSSIPSPPASPQAAAPVWATPAGDQASSAAACGDLVPVGCRIACSSMGLSWDAVSCFSPSALTLRAAGSLLSHSSVLFPSLQSAHWSCSLGHGAVLGSARTGPCYLNLVL